MYESGPEDWVGGLEASEGSLEVGDVGGLGGSESEDGDPGAASDGAAPAVLGVADGSGVWVDHGAMYVNICVDL